MLSQDANKKAEGLQQEVTALEKVLQILVSFISKKGEKPTPNYPLFPGGLIEPCPKI